MIKIMSYELNNERIECLYDGTGVWLVIDQGHPIYCKTFREASQKMDEAIQELLGKRGRYFFPL